MPIDPISDLPVGLSIALSQDPKTMPMLGFFPPESHLRYIGRARQALHAEDLWELMAEPPQKDTTGTIRP